MNNKVCDIITDKFITKIKEDKCMPWQKPWKSLMFRNIVSKKPYRGVNVLMLALFGKDSDYITAKQIKAAGGTIKKGCKTIPIVFYAPIEREVNTPMGVEKKKTLLMRYYNVFNFSDCEGTKGLKPQSAELINHAYTNAEIEEKCKALSKNLTVPITYGGNHAAYSPSVHKIVMPWIGQFDSMEAFQATFWHEVGHSLSKDRGIKLDTNFGNEQYSKEELVAELFANFCLSHVGIDSSKVANNSRDYFASWLSKISGDPKLLISAASEAQKRFDILLELAAGKVAETPEVEPALELVEA